MRSLMPAAARSAVRGAGPGRGAPGTGPVGYWPMHHAHQAQGQGHGKLKLKRERPHTGTTLRSWGAVEGGSRGGKRKRQLPQTMDPPQNANSKRFLFSWLVLSVDTDCAQAGHRDAVPGRALFHPLCAHTRARHTAAMSGLEDSELVALAERIEELQRNRESKEQSVMDAEELDA